MGLSITVGMLADLLEMDPEGAQWLQDELSRLNKYLPTVGLGPHTEPRACEVFSCDMFHYSGLHYLRRIAAHLDLRGALPPPGGDDAADDSVTHEYCRVIGPPGLLGRLLGRRPQSRSYDHLIMHSDSEGYYLPQDFPKVLFPPDEFEVAGGMIGSSVRLRQECERLAAALELPLDLDEESDAVWDLIKSQGQGDVKWRRYGIESFTCLRLYKACDHSIETGAAVVFC